jgi:hypothetical protein
MTFRNWQECLDAIQCLGEVRLIMRKPNDWYVDQHVEVKDRAVLISVSGNGSSPEEAVHDHWNNLTSLQPGQYIVARAAGSDRIAVRWAGHMWKPVNEVSQ